MDWKRCIITLRLRTRSWLTHFTVVHECIYGHNTKQLRGKKRNSRKATEELRQDLFFFRPQPVGIVLVATVFTRVANASSDASSGHVGGRSVKMVVWVTTHACLFV